MEFRKSLNDRLDKTGSADLLCIPSTLIGQKEGQTHSRRLESASELLIFQIYFG